MHQAKNLTLPQEISATGEHLSVFWPNLYCTCAETPISEIPVNILTSPLPLVTPVFLKENNNLAIRRRLHVFFHCTIGNILPYFYFWLIDLMTLNVYHMLCCAIRYFSPTLNSVKYPFMTYNVFTATLWRCHIDLTLNVSSVSDVMWSNSIPNFSKISAELYDFQYVQFGAVHRLGFLLEVDFYNSIAFL